MWSRVLGCTTDSNRVWIIVCAGFGNEVAAWLCPVTVSAGRAGCGLIRQAPGLVVMVVPGQTHSGEITQGDSMSASPSRQADRPEGGVVQELTRDDVERKRFLKMAGRMMGTGAAATGL